MEAGNHSDTAVQIEQESALRGTPELGVFPSEPAYDESLRCSTDSAFDIAEANQDGIDVHCLPFPMSWLKHAKQSWTCVTKQNVEAAIWTLADHQLEIQEITSLRRFNRRRVGPGERCLPASAYCLSVAGLLATRFQVFPIPIDGQLQTAAQIIGRLVIQNLTRFL